MLIGYARVSTEDQELHLQHDALRSAGCEEIFSEKVSGAAKVLPERERLLGSVSAGDVVIVWKLDRLSRSMQDLLAVVGRLQEMDVGLRSLKESIDTTSATGRLVFHFFAALAEFERELVRERTMAGLEAARERGRVGGRRRKISEIQLRAARELLASGEATATELAERIGVHPETLRRALRRDLKNTF